NTNHALALDDLTVAANPLDRCEHFHFCPLSTVLGLLELLGPEHNPCPTQIVWGQFHRDLVSRQDPDVIHSHLARYMAQHHMPIFQLHSKRRIWEVFQDLTLHLDNVVFCHSICSLSWALSELEFRP